MQAAWLKVESCLHKFNFRFSTVKSSNGHSLGKSELVNLSCPPHVKVSSCRGLQSVDRGPRFNPGSTSDFLCGLGETLAVCPQDIGRELALLSLYAAP